MIKIRVRTINSLISKLTKLALPSDLSGYVFRGHADAGWRLQSTYNRYSTSNLYEYRNLAFDHLITQYENNLTSMGDNRMSGMTRRGKIEFARHGGVPSPLIDFTRSPLVALWFAFNGVRGSVRKEENVAIYALDWNVLAQAYM